MFSPIFLSCLLVNASLPADAIRPDILALLQGAEQSRMSIRSATVQVRLVNRPASENPQVSRMTIYCDQDRRTVIESVQERTISPSERDRYEELILAKKPLPTDVGELKDREVRSAWGSDQLVQYRTGNPAAAYKKIENGVGDLVPDPRVIGLSDTMSLWSTPRVALRLDVIKSLGTVEADRVNGIAVWRCLLMDTNGNKFEFFIEDSPLFRVHRVKYTTEDGSRVATIDSSFKPGDTTSPLPQSATIRWVDDKGQSRRHVTVEITSVSQEAVRSDVGRLSSLDLPKGVMVVDNRSQQQLGYWDGKKLTAEFVSTDEDTGPLPPTPPASDTSGPGGPLLVIGILAVALIVLAVVAVLLRARSAKRPPPPPPPQPPAAG